MSDARGTDVSDDDDAARIRAVVRAAIDRAFDEVRADLARGDVQWGRENEECVARGLTYGLIAYMEATT